MPSFECSRRIICPSAAKLDDTYSCIGIPPLCKAFSRVFSVAKALSVVRRIKVIRLSGRFANVAERKTHCVWGVSVRIRLIPCVITDNFPALTLLLRCASSKMNRTLCFSHNECRKFRRVASLLASFGSLFPCRRRIQFCRRC